MGEVLAIILLLIVVIIVIAPRRRGRGRCPECGLGTLHRCKTIKLPDPRFRQRMTLSCDMCGTIVIDGLYRAPHPRTIAILEEPPPPPPPPGGETWSEVVKGG